MQLRCCRERHAIFHGAVADAPNAKRTLGPKRARGRLAMGSRTTPPPPNAEKDAGNATAPCTPNFGDPKSSLLACQGRKEEQVDPLRWAGAPRGDTSGQRGGRGAAARRRWGGSLPEPAPGGSICSPKRSLETFQTTN